ncbi:MAG: hypothetical protein AB8B57_06535 [Congregibacter sp.]
MRPIFKLRATRGVSAVAVTAITALTLITTQAQAAIPVSGFTVEQASTPYGLIAMASILLAMGLYRLRSSR